MDTIAIVNEKGGTGKTTTAVSLSAALGQLGRQVLLVDLDGQAASSRWLGVEEDTSFADALWRGDGLEPVRDVATGVSLAPGSGKLDSVAHDLRPTQGGQLRKLLSQVAGFDHCIIDCPPSLGNRLIGNALLAADRAIVPVETSILALDGLKILLTTFEDVRDGFGHEIELAGVLACRYDARTKLSRFILEELRRALPGKVFETVIRENVRARECPASGQSIFGYAPDSRAAEDYMALAKELLAMADALGADPPADESARAETPAPGHGQEAPDMRRQVDALLQEFSPRAAREPAVPPAPQARPAEAPAVAAPPDSPPSNVEAIMETLSAAPAPRTVEPTAPAEPGSADAQFQCLDLYHTQGGAESPPPQPAAPAPTPPDLPPPPAPQPDADSRPQPPPPPDPQPKPDQGDYAALRAMLDSMAGQPKPPPSDDPGAAEEPPAAAPSGWRRMFGKRSA